MNFLTMRFYNKYHFQQGLNGPTALNKSQDIGINVTGCRIFNISVKMAGFMVPFMKNVSGVGSLNCHFNRSPSNNSKFSLRSSENVWPGS